MKALLYKTIYHPKINPGVLRLNRMLLPLMKKKVRIPPSGTITLQNPEGKKVKMKTNQSSYVTQLLYWYGYEQFEYVSIFTALIKKVNCFFDIGANTGLYSLLAAMENENIEIHAFEPSSGPLTFLRENVRINGFDNITVNDVALSESSGNLTFYEAKNEKYSYLEHNLGGEGNAGSKIDALKFKETTVNCIRLDDYVKQVKMNNIDLMKIDTEGTEDQILRSATALISKYEPIIVCETLFNTIEEELEAIMKPLNYRFFNYSDDGLHEVDSLHREEDNGVRDCFFVPESKMGLIEEYVVG